MKKISKNSKIYKNIIIHNKATWGYQNVEFFQTNRIKHMPDSKNECTI